MPSSNSRDDGSGWVGWAYAHQDFGRIKGAALQLAHSDSSVCSSMVKLLVLGIIS